MHRQKCQICSRSSSHLIELEFTLHVLWLAPLTNPVMGGVSNQESLFSQAIINQLKQLILKNMMIVETDSTPSCCLQFGAKFCRTFFFDAMGVNLEASFCMGEHSHWIKILTKFVLWGWTVSIYMLGFVQFEHTKSFMAYNISCWLVLYVCLYLTLSLAFSIVDLSPVLVAMVHTVIVVLLFLACLAGTYGRSGASASLFRESSMCN